jgi:predicted Fe-Mo cluster-binding NifX family protein
MLKKIAFASTDGIIIDQHFGMADMFYIYEIKDKIFSLIERRRFARSSQRCHNDENFEKAYQTLKDCDAVFSAKIGQSAANYLIKKNIRVFEINAKIEDVLNGVLEDNEKG